MRGSWRPSAGGSCRASPPRSASPRSRWGAPGAGGCCAPAPNVDELSCMRRREQRVVCETCAATLRAAVAFHGHSLHHVGQRERERPHPGAVRAALLPPVSFTPSLSHSPGLLAASQSVASSAVRRCTVAQLPHPPLICATGASPLALSAEAPCPSAWHVCVCACACACVCACVLPAVLGSDA